jgi:excisionase family DNA binding protein
MANKDAALLALEALLDLPARVTELRQEVLALRHEVRELKKVLPPTLVSATVAARHLGIHPKTVRRHIETGELRGVRMGTAIRVDMSSVMERLAVTKSVAATVAATL